MFPKLNHQRAAFLLPGLQIHLGHYRLDVIGRLGVTAGAGPIGGITYSGTNSITLRLTRILD